VNFNVNLGLSLFASFYLFFHIALRAILLSGRKGSTQCYTICFLYIYWFFGWLADAFSLA